MQAVAKTKYIRYSCRKLRQVADVIRGRSVDQAFAILSILKQQKKGAEILERTLKSAVANLENNNENEVVSRENLTVSTIMVDGGPIIKRIRPRSQGRAFRIHKNLSHLTLTVSD
jgi:large subunit ribosomal protein L22